MYKFSQQCRWHKIHLLRHKSVQFGCRTKNIHQCFHFYDCYFPLISTPFNDTLWESFEDTRTSNSSLLAFKKETRKALRFLISFCISQWACFFGIPEIKDCPKKPSHFFLYSCNKSPSYYYHVIKRNICKMIPLTGHVSFQFPLSYYPTQCSCQQVRWWGKKTCSGPIEMVPFSWCHG